MKKALSLFLTIVFAVSIAVAQSQQLKTFHFFCPGGKEYPNDLSYTGYEDELGNITKHGSWTANLSGGKFSLNFKQGKLDGKGTITSPSKTCYLKYADDKLVSINYVEKKNSGNIILKYTLNNDGLMVGDFEFENAEEILIIYEDFREKERHYFKHIKGKFDDFGKATGWWEIELTGSNKGVVKKYFEQGYCLGTDEKTIELSRAYLIDKIMSEKELHNMGYSVISAMPIPDLKRKMEVALSSAENYICYMNDFNENQCMSLKIRNVFNLNNIFNNISLQGSPITYMSSELYQSIINQIKNNNRQVTLKYDAQLDKYYVLKVDGVSRLYIPVESENNFKDIIGDNHESCGELIDYDGNKYNTVLIGSQCWMKENLRTTHYANGTEIPLAETMTYDVKQAYRYCPDGNASNIPAHGYLYNWSAIMNGTNSSNSNPSYVQGICPTGWHMPSDAEWSQLTNYISNHDKYVCGNDNKNIAKSLALISYWYENSNDCAVGNNMFENNTSGFSAIPAGFYSWASKFQPCNFGKTSVFWSSTEKDNGKALKYSMGSGFATFEGGPFEKECAFSVRCLKD